MQKSWILWELGALSVTAIITEYPFNNFWIPIRTHTSWMFSATCVCCVLQRPSCITYFVIIMLLPVAYFLGLKDPKFWMLFWKWIVIVLLSMTICWCEQLGKLRHSNSMSEHFLIGQCRLKNFSSNDSKGNILDLKGILWDRRWSTSSIRIFSHTCWFFYGNAFLIMKLSKLPSFRAIRAPIASQSTFEI